MATLCMAQSVLIWVGKISLKEIVNRCNYCQRLQQKPNWPTEIGMQHNNIKKTTNHGLFTIFTVNLISWLPPAVLGVVTLIAVVKSCFEQIK